MKIGILTLPLHTNYGGILQAYALQTVLERMGHEVKVINLDRKPHSYSIGDIIKQFIKRVLSSVLSIRFYEYYNIRKEVNMRYNNFLIKSKYTQPFINKYIHNYWVRNYTSDIDRGDFDAIVVGSDQIWNHTRSQAIGGVQFAFLPFLKNNDVIRLSYAASFGKDNWEYTAKETEIAREYIKKFAAVSVRESSGIKLCQEKLDIKAIRHIDPTMLLTAEDYINKLALNSEEKSPGNLLIYLIDSSAEKDSIVDYIEETLSLKKFIVNSKAEDFQSNNNINDCIQPPVEKWLRGFMDAEFVITDSFHACVFSILFHKPFVVIGNTERGIARINSLMEMFDIKGRLVSNISDAKLVDLSAKLPLSSIESVLTSERSKATDYLKEYLRIG